MARSDTSQYFCSSFLTCYYKHAWQTPPTRFVEHGKCHRHAAQSHCAAQLLCILPAERRRGGSQLPESTPDCALRANWHHMHALYADASHGAIVQPKKFKLIETNKLFNVILKS